MSQFKQLKEYLSKDRNGYVCYDSPYSGYIDDLYCQAVSKLEGTYSSLYVEPSIMGGQGRNFAFFTQEGVTYSANWDFEQECVKIEQFAVECRTETELITAICSYIEDRLENATAYYSE